MITPKCQVPLQRLNRRAVVRGKRFDARPVLPPSPLVAEAADDLLDERGHLPSFVELFQSFCAEAPGPPELFGHPSLSVEGSMPSSCGTGTRRAAPRRAARTRSVTWTASGWLPGGV